MFLVFCYTCRQTNILRTGKCKVLYWYLRSRTTNLWRFWCTSITETWNCEPLRPRQTHMHCRREWRRPDIVLNSCLLSANFFQFWRQVTFLALHVFPAGNGLALPKTTWRPALRRAIWPWQTHWNKAMLNATICKLILVTISFSPTMEEISSLAFSAAYQKNN